MRALLRNAEDTTARRLTGAKWRLIDDNRCLLLPIEKSRVASCDSSPSLPCRSSISLFTSTSAVHPPLRIQPKSFDVGIVRILVTRLPYTIAERSDHSDLTIIIMRIHRLLDFALLVTTLAVPAQQHKHDNSHTHEHNYKPKEKRQYITDPYQQGIYDYIVGKEIAHSKLLRTNKLTWDKLVLEPEVDQLLADLLVLVSIHC